MKLHLFDDVRTDGWHPFSLSRPVSELRFGVLLQRSRLERWAGRTSSAIHTRPWLASFSEGDAPEVRSREEIEPAGDPDGERLWLSTRWVPPQAADAAPGDAPAPDVPGVLRCGDRVVGWRLPAGTPGPETAWLSTPGDDDAGPPGAAVVEVGGSVLEEPWDLVAGGAERIRRDVRALAPAASLRSEGDLPEGVRLLGQRGVYLGEGVSLEPGVVLDTRGGPVWLDRDVEVRADARLAGPLWAGPECRLLGGDFEALAAGPVSYLRGEIARVTTLGWVNKAHAGYLGHAYLGRWVNLGAGTISSDLKNNYGPVRVGGPDGDRETGLVKMGCLLGDHVKTAIGTLLATGAVIGTGANVFGGPLTPRWVPPFRWGLAPDAPRYRREAFLESAETVMGRRGVSLDGAARAWLAAVWEESRAREEAAG